MAEPLLTSIVLVPNFVSQPVDRCPGCVRLAVEDRDLGFFQAQIVLLECEARERRARLAFEFFKRVRPLPEETFVITDTRLIYTDHIAPLPGLGQVEMFRVDNLVLGEVADVAPLVGDLRPGCVLDVFEDDKRRSVKFSIANDREEGLTGFSCVVKTFLFVVED